MYTDVAVYKINTRREIMPPVALALARGRPRLSLSSARPPTRPGDGGLNGGHKKATAGDQQASSRDDLPEKRKGAPGAGQHG